jgi:hypothetical protein
MYSSCRSVWSGESDCRRWVRRFTVIVSSSVEGMLLGVVSCCCVAAVAHVSAVLSDGVSEKRCRDERLLSGRTSSLRRARIDSGDGCRRGRENYMDTISFVDARYVRQEVYIHHLWGCAGLLLRVGQGEKQVARHLRVVLSAHVVLVVIVPSGGSAGATWVVHGRGRGTGVVMIVVCKPNVTAEASSRPCCLVYASPAPIGARPRK